MSGRATKWWVGSVMGFLAISGCEASTGPEHDPRDPVGRVWLTHLPVDPENVLAFIGLGNLNVLPEDHGGFFTPREVRLQAPTIPVYAPADGRVVEIIRDWNPALAPYGHDLHMTITVSTTMTVSFAHMSDFSPKLWGAAADLEPGYASHRRVDIEVEAGEIVGYTGTVGALDFHIKDAELDLRFANPSRYPDPWLIAGCYHDYYQEPIRSRFEAITWRTAEPRCGKIDFDLPGRIIGNWFLEGEVPSYAFDDYSTHLAIVYDELYGELIAIADGIAIRPTSPHAGDEHHRGARVFWVEGNTPAPETVGAEEGLVKYAIMDRLYPNPPDLPPPAARPVAGTFLVQVLADDRIRVERVMGKTPAEVDGFGANARTYIR
jgi:hypothetical protein